MVDTSLSGIRGVRELDRLTRERTMPTLIVSDNRAGLSSIAGFKLAADRLALQPTGQTSAERLHRKLQSQAAR